MLRAWRIESVIWTCKLRDGNLLHERIPQGENYYKNQGEWIF